MQLIELQLYINNIARCLVIFDIPYSRIKNHQWYTIIKCNTLFTSQLSSNYNSIYRDSVILSNSEQYTSPTKYLFLVMYPSINTLSGSNYNINISNEATTIPNSPSTFLLQSNGTTNPGGTLKPENSLKGIQNPIPWNPDNRLKGIRGLVPNRIRSQCLIGLTIPT